MATLTEAAKVITNAIATEVAKIVPELDEGKFRNAHGTYVLPFTTLTANSPDLVPTLGVAAASQLVKDALNPFARGRIDHLMYDGLTLRFALIDNGKWTDSGKHMKRTASAALAAAAAAEADGMDDDAIAFCKRLKPAPNEEYAKWVAKQAEVRIFAALTEKYTGSTIGSITHGLYPRNVYAIEGWPNAEKGPNSAITVTITPLHKNNEPPAVYIDRAEPNLVTNLFTSMLQNAESAEIALFPWTGASGKHYDHVHFRMDAPLDARERAFREQREAGNTTPFGEQ